MEMVVARVEVMRPVAAMAVAMGRRWGGEVGACAPTWERWMERAFWRVAVRGVAAFVRWGGYENAHRGCTCIFASVGKKGPWCREWFGRIRAVLSSMERSCGPTC